MANLTKNHYKRLCLIDSILRNSRYPSKEKIITHVTNKMIGGDDRGVCESTIEKDMFTLKEWFDAPIKYSRKNNGYYYEEPYQFWKIFLQQWSLYLELPKDISKLINE